MEIKERIARAICDESGYSWDGPSDEPDGITEFDEIGSEKPSRETFRNYSYAALRTLAEAGPTDGMVEKVAKVMNDEALKQRVSQIQGFSDYPNSTRHWIRDLTLRRGDDVIWDGGPSSEAMLAELDRITARIIARAALQAALKDMAGVE